MGPWLGQAGCPGGQPARFAIGTMPARGSSTFKYRIVLKGDCSNRTAPWNLMRDGLLWGDRPGSHRIRVMFLSRSIHPIDGPSPPTGLAATAVRPVAAPCAGWKCGTTFLGTTAPESGATQSCPTEHA